MAFGCNVGVTWAVSFPASLHGCVVRARSFAGSISVCASAAASVREEEDMDPGKTFRTGFAALLIASGLLVLDTTSSSSRIRVERCRSRSAAARPPSGALFRDVRA